MNTDQFKKIQDDVAKSATETEKPLQEFKKAASLVRNITLGFALSIIVILLLVEGKGCDAGVQTQTSSVQQPTTTTETRRVTDMEFCAPVMVNGSQYRASTVPDIPIIVRINGNRIVHLKRESEGGTVDLGSGINTLEYKADGPYIATVSVDIKHW